MSTNLSIRAKLLICLGLFAVAIAALIDMQIGFTKEPTPGTEMSGVVALLAGLVWLLAFTVMRSGVIRPVRNLTESLERLAAGERVEIPYAEQDDEMGRIARACEVLRATAEEKSRLASAAAESHAQAVGALRAGVVALAKGDLTADITTPLPPEYEGVRVDFNAALASLRELIGAVTESATGIRTGSSEIAQASEDLARRTEGNAASLEETSAALVQIDERLKATAVAANRTVERADQAIATVSGGRSVADEAVQAMGRVSESAKGIDSVIEGLDKIAFQTRVLAMNAAVEAGRAGDAGRGFAVVADLVSALAMRAEEEAKRARDQLTVTQTDIVTAVDAVQKVDGALANISGDVSEVHGLLGSMAADNQAQSSAITQISAAISTMDQSTQQNAAMVEETSAAAQNLMAEVTALAEHAAAFRTSEAKKPTAKAAPKNVSQPEPIKVKGPATRPKTYVSPVAPLPIHAMATVNGSYRSSRMNGHDASDWKDF